MNIYYFWLCLCINCADWISILHWKQKNSFHKNKRCRSSNKYIDNNHMTRAWSGTVPDDGSQCFTVTLNPDNTRKLIVYDRDPLVALAKRIFAECQKWLCHSFIRNCKQQYCKHFAYGNIPKLSDKNQNCISIFSHKIEFRSSSNDKLNIETHLLC